MPSMRAAVSAQPAAAGASRNMALSWRRTERWSGTRVLVLAPGPGLLRLAPRRALAQQRVVRGDEAIRCRHGVRVVHGAVLARERDEGGVLAQAVLQLRAGLLRPLLQLHRRVLDDLLDLRDLLGLAGGQRETEVEGELGAVRRHP